MGGGGAMRAAAKIAAIGVSTGGGLRGAPSMPPAENLVSAAVRNASRPVAAIVSSHDGVADGDVVAPVQRPSWELEDWEFSGYEEDLTLLKTDPLPRVVFGGFPTMKEAEDATSELTDWLNKVCPKSPNSTSSEGSSILGQEPSQPKLLSNSEFAEAKACVSSETSVSKHGFHAFKFISESPAAQRVVASIACDPNVWNAVMQNEELTNYIQAHKIAAPSPEMDLNESTSAADGDFQEQDPTETEKPFEDGQSGNLGTGFVSFIENVKCTVVDMFSNLSSFVMNTFGGSVAENKSVDADGSNGHGVPSMDTTGIGSLFLGFAVFVIILVVMKRG